MEWTGFLRALVESDSVQQLARAALTEFLSPDGEEEIEDVQGRGFSSSGGYTKGIKFPSVELALLALAFLTFATQFAVNVQQLVAAIQNGRRKRALNDADFMHDILLENSFTSGSGNATEEIFRLSHLIESAGDKLEHVFNRISDCRSSLLTF